MGDLVMTLLETEKVSVLAMAAYCETCSKPTPTAWYYGHVCEAAVTDAEVKESQARYGRKGHANPRYAIAWRKLHGPWPWALE